MKIRYHDIISSIQAIDFSINSYELFSRFLDVTSSSLYQAVVKTLTGNIDESIENHVIGIQKSVKNPDNFSKVFAQLVLALERDEHDVLGTVVGELGQLDKSYKGQVFTPSALADLTSESTLRDVLPDPSHRLTLCEPACGGGAMLIAASKILKKRGFYPWNYYWEATDIDKRCFQMTYIQATLLGIPATVIHGNTMSSEQWVKWPTFAASQFPYREQATPEKPKTKLLKVKKLKRLIKRC